MGNIAFAHNAVIDQFIGDGMLIVFGGNANARDHKPGAVKAAREMRAAFVRLRERWSTIHYRGAESLFIRLGLSTGLVTRTEVGHRQFRRVTVLGACVNNAAPVCERAPRGRDTICLSRALRDDTGSETRVIGEEDCGIYELRD